LIARILLLARYNLGSVFACQRTMQQAEQEQKEKHKSPKKPLFKRILKWLGVVAMVNRHHIWPGIWLPLYASRQN
jgi:uncharacterized membrane protein